MKKIRAIFFDLDGTLIDTIQDLKAAVDQALAAMGRPEHTVEEYLSYIGRGSRHLISSALGPGATPDEIDSCYKLYMNYYLAHISERSQAYPGMEAVLKRAEQAGYELVVFTNKPQEAAERLLKDVLPGCRFKAVLGPSDRFPPKPDPRGLKHLLTELDLEPEEIMYVGDSDVDMEVAAAAGIACRVGARYGYQEEARLKNSGASFLISHPRQLNALIDRLGFSHNISFLLIVSALVAVIATGSILTALWVESGVFKVLAGLVAGGLFAYYVTTLTLTLFHRSYFSPTGIAVSTSVASGITLLALLFGRFDGHRFALTNVGDLVLFVAALAFLALALTIAFHRLFKSAKRRNRRQK